MKEMRAQAAERVKKASGGHTPTPVPRASGEKRKMMDKEEFEKLKKMIEDIKVKEDEKERERQQYHPDL
jgi:hypothetical protein